MKKYNKFTQFMGYVIWEFTDFFHIKLGKAAPVVFGWVMGVKGEIVVDLKGKCKRCFHSEACKSWIRNGMTLYDDYTYSTNNCPYHINETDVIINKKSEETNHAD